VTLEEALEMCYIENTKRETTSGLPQKFRNFFYKQPSLFAVMAAIFVYP